MSQVICEFKRGDRIEGIGSHRGKSGEVRAVWHYPKILIRWDGGRINSNVNVRYLTKVES